jgi:hypothetical protein
VRILKKLEEQLGSKKLRYLIVLICNTVLFMLIYRVPIAYGELTNETFYAFVIMVTYLALLLGFALAYLIYNRFFYRKDLTPEQLPDTWSAAQKTAFLADGELRLEKSKWMLTIIFPLVVTFLFDAVELFIIDTFWR